MWPHHLKIYRRPDPNINPSRLPSLPSFSPAATKARIKRSFSRIQTHPATLPKNTTRRQQRAPIPSMKLIAGSSRHKPKPSPNSPLPVQSSCGEYSGGEKKTVVVGIRRDAVSRELLTWALVKVANAGDRVVALHVANATAAVADGGGGLELEEKIEAADSLVSVLAVYDGFCNLKQINLELKVCGGLPIRKTLVKEASSYGAAHLILGVSKNSRTFGSSSTAVAKYCAKRVPPDCSVLAVNNGKIVYQRGGEQQESYHCSMLETPRRSYRKFLSAKLMIGDRERDCSIKDNRPISQAVSMLTKEVSLALVPMNNYARELPEVATGWPLLRKKLMPDRKPTLPDRSKVSVVQWAMRLPSRYSAVSPVHSERKTATPDSAANSDQIFLDRAVIPFRSNSGRPSPVIEELEKEIPEELVSLKEKYSSIYTLFSYGELAKITSNFSPECIIGKGGTSHVYKGTLPNGKELAVKILKSSDEILEEFVSEIEIISSLDNKNIISLVGFCFENDNLMLVYDYLQRGSLEELLHSEKEIKNPFGWTERFRVAVGVARALGYLHGNGNDRPVIHRDVKSSNILVSEDFEPKLSDFGLALWASDATSEITCNDVAGTFGYLAPEYFMYGKVNDKIDVYAFGVVLLELISGRKPVCTTGRPKGQESLVMWANSVIQGGKLAQLVDPSLPSECNADEIERMVLAASLCIRRAPQSRPQIAAVLKLLDGDSDVLKWARSQAGVSDESDGADGEVTQPDNSSSNIQSYINFALLGVDDDAASVVSSTDFIAANTSLEEYLRERWSRSSSVD